jgi:hypothetical protein
MPNIINGKRILMALGLGVLITILTFVITVAVGSDLLASILLWQARALCYRECKPGDLCEGNPGDIICALVGLFLGMLIYTLASYMILTLLSIGRAREVIK